MDSEILLRDATRFNLPIFFEGQLDPEATAMAAFHTQGLKYLK